MIQINLIRISADSQYLEISAQCDVGHSFNTLNVNRYLGNSEYSDTIDLSSKLPANSNSIVLRIATSIFGTDVTMYTVELGVTQILNEDVIPNVVAKCSNINFVYANLLDLILKLTNNCVSSQDYDVLDRNHMILFAHQEAMRLERYSEAEYFYDIIMKLFSNCGSTTRQIGIINKPCGCQ